MILIDTSVWVDHLRAMNTTLASLLHAGGILGHPFVTGELALGNLRQRDLILSAMQELPQAIVAANEEVFHFIDREALFGLGIRFVDAHLLAAVQLTAGAKLWTRDPRLQAVATRLRITAALSP